MMTLTLANKQVRYVTSGVIDIPRTGIWIADVMLNDVEVPSGQVVATLGAVAMPATVARAELINGMIQLRLQGGNGDIGQAARPKHYYRPLVRHVLADLLRDAGEVMSSDSTPEVLGQQLEAWTTLAIPTGAVIAALCRVAGSQVNWRVNWDGTVWIGAETWQDSPAVVRSIESDGANASTVVGADLPAVWPGVVLGGRKIDYVTFDLDKNRATLLYAEGQT